MNTNKLDRNLFQWKRAREKQNSNPTAAHSYSFHFKKYNFPKKIGPILLFYFMVCVCLLFLDQLVQKNWSAPDMPFHTSAYYDLSTDNSPIHSPRRPIRSPLQTTPSSPSLHPTHVHANVHLELCVR